MNTPAESPARLPETRPRDAATLLVLRNDRDAVRVLMGQRSDRHVFHPGSFVFPGGRVCREDRFAPSLDELRPAEAASLGVRTRAPSKARAIAMAAIRETFEEVGILIGAHGKPETRRPLSGAWQPFYDAGIVPTLSPLRFLARAITPPGRIRRFDARFFAVFSDSVGAEIPPPHDELIEPAWLTFEEAEAKQLPYITRIVIGRLRDRLAYDPKLESPVPAVFHHTRYGRRVEEPIKATLSDAATD